MQLIFAGRIHPERANFAAQQIVLEHATTERKTNLSIDARLILCRSQISVFVETDTNTPDIPTIRNMVVDTLHALVDLIGFVEGAAYFVELTTLLLPEKKEMEVLGVLVAPLGQLRLSTKSILSIPDKSGENGIAITAALINDRALKSAIADLRRSLIYPEQTPMFAYRAIETIRHSLSAPGARKEVQSWEQLRETLRVTERFVQYMARESTPTRHAQPISVSGEKRLELMRRAWLLVDRYAYHVSHGKQALPVQFELLDAEDPSIAI